MKQIGSISFQRIIIRLFIVALSLLIVKVSYAQENSEIVVQAQEVDVVEDEYIFSEFNEEGSEEYKKEIASVFGQFDYFSADLTQNIIDGDNNIEQKGNIRFAKPNSFLFSLLGSDAQTVISDGNRIWRYYPNLDQVVIGDITPATRSTIPILLLGSDFEILIETFDVVKSNQLDDSSIVYRLYPSQQDSFEYIEISILDDRYLEKLDIIYRFGREVRVKFDNFSFDRIQNEIFNFDIPAGVDVIQE